MVMFAVIFIVSRNHLIDKAVVEVTGLLDAVVGDIALDVAVGAARLQHVKQCAHGVLVVVWDSKHLAVFFHHVAGNFLKAFAPFATAGK